METHPIHDSEQPTRIVAFELDRMLLRPWTVIALLSHHSGVRRLVKRGVSSGGSDVHYEFQFHDRPYVVRELRGKNRRYWIGPRHGVGGAGDISELEELFKRYPAPLWRRIVASLVDSSVLR